ncbi:MAG TPA: RtcB family protein [Bacillota bacterium]|nr:RtcB family protein [Bacillota bacterium]
MELVKESLNRYRLRRTGNMLVDGMVYVNENLLPLVKKDKSLQQLANAACLPGVVGRVCGMPDIHEGFGLPIGGVMATSEGGVISAGAVGMDINCGVRLLQTNVAAVELKPPFLRKLIDRIEDYVPTGVGKKGKHKSITEDIFAEVTHTGARGIVEKGYGSQEDVKRAEEEGCLPGADLGAVSREAYKRGAVQLGTLGGGNHFIELQVVDEVYDRAVAERFGLSPGLLTVMIHTGSRGFGHQICTDYSRSLFPAAKKYGIELPDRGLACAPVDSGEGKDYYAAMACAVNFAFANRQLITHDVRCAFGDVFGCNPEELGLKLIYDVAHNIAKWEMHGDKKVLVHRKGATRSLPPGHPGNPAVYRRTGHPVLIPGSMGTASYVLVGTERAAETFYSSNHGAGRTLSRTAAVKEISREQFEASMGNVMYNTRNYRELLDEAPGAYKDIDQVVETLAAIGMTRKVARLRPLAVIKGKD